MRKRLSGVLSLLLLLGAASCLDSETEETSFPVVEEARPDTNRVDIELDEYVEASDENAVNVFRVTKSSQLMEGVVAQGKLGDYILENDRARFLIEADDRAMNPCPYGGNVLDAVSRVGDPGEDIVGEVCLFLNGGQTLKPDYFEIIRDGSDGGSGVLAVTGHLELADFINLKGMVDDFVPGLADNIALETDNLLPLRVTLYYVLRPGDQGLRVITAMRNEGDETQHIVFSHLVASGGDGRYFNPLNGNGGYGTGSTDIVEAERLPFLAFRGEKSSYAYVPKPDEDLQADLPIGGSYIIISGVAASLLGAYSLIEVLTGSQKYLENGEEIIHLPPGETTTMEHWHFVGDGALSTMLDQAYPTIGVKTGTLRGRVVDTTGQPVAGALVTTVKEFERADRTMSQAITAEDGTYELDVPRGDYRVFARRDGQNTVVEQVVSLDDGREVDVPDVELATRAAMTVKVRTPDGAPTPARVTVICPSGACPNAPTSLEKDISFHRKPSRFAAVAWVGVDGELDLALPEGDYQVVVSRGFEWSVWPPDTMENGGKPVSLEPGKTVELEAEIAHVVDTSGAISGDFHVHAIPSPDSPVPLKERVLNFLAEGVDVIVSTDHDVVTDYGPAVAKLGANHEIASIVGEEITTSDLGHFNGFPVEYQPSHRRNGSLDWSRGAEKALTPREIFSWVKSHPGEQVVQVNHPESLGIVNQADVDVLRGISYAERDRKRLPGAEPDPDTGDTGLWSEDFTAMEVMNGTSVNGFYSIGRWWLTMVGRGFRPTGTAVTDTHKLYGDLGGAPRSYVFVSDETDTPATFDEKEFTTAVNDGKLVGSSGPFFEVHVENARGERAGLGETIATAGQTVKATIDIDVPAWMKVDTVDVFMNLPYEEVKTSPGSTNAEPFVPTERVSFELTDEDRTEVASGAHAHHHYTKRVELELNTDADAYAIFVVRGINAPKMEPVVPGTRPFAYSNPVYLDADGNGYDHPPYAELAKTLPPEDASIRAMHRPDVDPHDLPLSLEWNREMFVHLVHTMRCKKH